MPKFGNAKIVKAAQKYSASSKGTSEVFKYVIQNTKSKETFNHDKLNQAFDVFDALLDVKLPKWTI